MTRETIYTGVNTPRFVLLNMESGQPHAYPLTGQSNEPQRRNTMESTIAANGITQKVEGEEQLKAAMDKAFAELTPEARAKAEEALSALEKGGDMKLTLKQKLGVLKAYIPSDHQLGKGLAIAINITEDLLVHGASRLRIFAQNVAEGYKEGRK
jgi:hypothetical protein